MRPKASSKPVDSNKKEVVVSQEKPDNEERKNEKSPVNKDQKHEQRMKMRRDEALDNNIVDVFASQEEQKLTTN